MTPGGLSPEVIAALDAYARQNYARQNFLGAVPPGPLDGLEAPAPEQRSSEQEIEEERLEARRAHGDHAGVRPDAGAGDDAASDAYFRLHFRGRS